MHEANPGDSNTFKLVIQFARVCAYVCVCKREHERGKLTYNHKIENIDNTVTYVV